MITRGQLLNLVNILKQIDSNEDSLANVKLIAQELQPLVGELLRDAVDEAHDEGAGYAWEAIGKAMGMKRSVVWRQFYKMEGPMVSKWSRLRSKKPREE